MAVAEIVSNTDVPPSAVLIAGTILAAVVLFFVARWFLRWARS